MAKHQSNIFLIIAASSIHFFVSSFRSVQTLCGAAPRGETQAYPFLTQFLEQGPQAFQKHPTGIKLGRALYLPILYFFARYDFFKISKK